MLLLIKIWRFKKRDNCCIAEDYGYKPKRSTFSDFAQVDLSDM